MSSGDDHDPTNLTEDKHALIERRRPGRGRYTNRSLLALLRGTGGDASEPDKGSPARGIVIGLGISALLWSAIGLIVWIVLKRW